ncbi:MAG: site-specific DNA-methyltransferase [Bacteroidales bacterium]|nr:site-specific DNA-methyltransferase [Bacteroidales bacterium]
MPTLNWIGKEAVVNHHHNVPYRTLDKQYTFGDNLSDNKIIHGDNLEALKALLPEYEGRIKCIYIDPPYNTGNENWVYNDNVNSPKIKKWLGQVVGKEAEDLTRHDKWLCMMYPRLKLLQKLLSDDGAIFISIDDNEQANLKLICDEIFGAGNFVDIFSWNKTETPANLSHKTKKAIEYVICYQKAHNTNKFKGLSKNSASNNGLMNQTNSIHELVFPPNKIDTNLKDGVYTAGKYGTKSYEIFLLEDTEVKNGFFIKPVRLQGKFKWGQENLDKEIGNGTIVSIKTNAFSPSYEKVEYEPEVPWNLISKKFGVQTNENASEELIKIFGNKVFDFPKPPSLVEYLINFLCDKSSIILDSFAGSGTTAHAVLNLNKADGGNRKFILVEMEDYAETITSERVKRVINGYGEGKNAVEGTGGSFSFYELGEPIFNEDGYLNETVGIEKLREYIWYSETRVPYAVTKQSDYLLGNHDETAYYFYYKKDEITTLSHETLGIITEKAETYVVYADQCAIDKEWLAAHNIIFKKIPRDIRRF